MRRVVLWMQQSADGFAAGPDGSFDWPVVSPDLHRFFVEGAQRMSAFLYGRRIWEMMAAYWPTADEDPSATAETVAFARLWRPMPKFVFSSTLDRAGWDTTILSGDLVDEVTALKEQPGADLALFGGPTLAASFLQRGLVDEFVVFVHPVVLGGGVPLFPPLASRQRLRLLESRAFDGGVVLHHHERA